MPPRHGDQQANLEVLKVESQLHPDRPRVVVTDGAQIPRERSVSVAWWVAIIATIILIPTLAIAFPDSYRRILVYARDGIQTTFEITVISIGAALLVGLLAGLGRTSKNPIINGIATLYVEVIRGIPLLAQLFWIYYALARFLVLGPRVSAIIGLAICYGAYIGEIFRAGIQSISKGQWEAARSLGMSGGQAMRYVILPQAIRVVLPPVGNEFIALLKDSSLVSVLAISDLLRRGREYASRTFQYFETYTMVALVYLLMTLVFSRVVFYIERGMSIEGKEEGPAVLMHRLAAHIADFVLLYVIWIATDGLLGLVFDPLSTAIAGIPLAAWTALIIFLAYLVAFWTLSGQTPGQMAVGLRVIGPDEQKPSFVRVVLRLLPLLLTALSFVTWLVVWGAPMALESLAPADVPWPAHLLLVVFAVGVISAVWCQWDRYGQGWHDKLAGTYVIRVS
jgi:polar amino acid transport system permease protein